MSKGSDLFIKVYLLLLGTGLAQIIPASWSSSPLSSTLFEGQDFSYCSFSGSNGLKLSVILPSTASTVSFDYSLMFWFRLQSPSVVGQQQNIFQIPQGPACYLTQTQLVCNTGQAFDLNGLPNLKQWIHITYTTNKATSSSLLMVNFPQSSSTTNGTFVSLTSNNVFLGIGSQLTKSSGLRGDVRDFYMSVGKVSQQVVPLIFHIKKVFEMSCMAYYQFDQEQGHLKDTFRNQQAVPLFATDESPPLFLKEEATSQQCSIFEANTLDNLPTFQPSYSAPPISIPNFKGLQTGFTYTLNLWLKNGGGQNFSTSATDGIVNSSFFSLSGAFTLWFDSPTSFRVFVDANLNANKITSPSVFLPLNEWINIQLTLSQASGLTVFLFNSNGAQIQSMSISNALGPQTPINQATLFQNFDGAVKTLLFWEQSFTLPMSSSASSTNLKLSFDFSASRYSNNQWQSYPLTGQVLSGLSGQGFWFSQMRVPNFSSVNFSNPSKLGTLSANSTLWDGLGCTQTFKYNNLYGPIQQSLLLRASDSLTAELWFSLKTKQTATRISLVQLSTSDEDSLTIFIENGVLKCAPFGYNDTQSILVFTGVQPYNNSGWQHVSCGFTQNKQVFGQYLAYNMSSSTTFQSILPLSFGKSLASKQATDQSKLQVKTNQILIGTPAVSLALREIRVWSELRSVEQLFYNRFRQVESTDPSLQLNYKFATGNNTIMNEAMSGGVASTSDIAVSMITANQTTLLICPVDRFFDFRVQGCVAMPFDLLPVTYITQLTLQNGFQQVFTNQFLKSSILLASQVPSTSQVWSLSDKAIDTSHVSLQRTQARLLINPITLGDGYKYNLTSVLVDSKNSFWLNTSQTIYPKKCSYLADQVSKISVNSLTIQPNTSTCFNMAIFGVDGCYSNYYNVLQNQVLVQSSPNIPSLQASANITVNRVSKQIQVCFNPQAVLQMPINQPISLVFSAFWATDQEQNVTSQSYSNVVYEVRVITPANVTVGVQGIFTNQQDTILLDASNSTIQGQNSSGLVFNWLCPPVFQSVCDIFKYSPVLEITDSMMMTFQASKSQDFMLTVQVWALGFGMNVTTGSHVFSKQVVVNWSKIVAPRINILINQLQGQSSPAILATQDSSAQVQIYNYRSTDQNINVNWSITPATLVVSSLVSNSSDGATINFQQGSLLPNTSYNLTVSVMMTGGQKGTQTIQFRTGTPPSPGSIIVSPTSGTMFTTVFNISLSNWTSNSQLKATLWGITQMQPFQRVQITQSQVPISENGSFIASTILPQIIGIQLEVFNQIGERTVQTLNVTSGRQVNSRQSWTTITKGLLSSNFSLLKVQKYFFLSSIAHDCRSDFVANLTDSTDCIDSSNLILSWAVSDLKNLQSNDNSSLATGILQASTSIIVQISKYPQTLDSNSSIGVYDMIQMISSRTTPFVSSLTDKNFQMNYAQTISNLIQYASLLTSPVTVGRRLQQDPQSMLNGLIVQKNYLLDKLCLVSEQNSINATGIYLATYQYSLTDSILDQVVQDQQFIGQSLVIPIKSILIAEASNDPLTNTVCLQVSTMAMNPVPSYLFSNQSIFNNSFIQVSTLDDQGHRLLNSKGVSVLVNDPFQVSFNYDFSDKRFVEGQTVCLSYNSNNLPARWNNSLCATSYTATQIVCSCNQMNNFYYALGNDLSLDKVSFWKISYQWCWQYLIIFITFIFFVLVLPCLGIYLDRKDYQAIEIDQFKVSEEVLQYLFAQRRYECEQELYYKLKDIEVMQGWSTLTFWNAYSIIRLNIHPIWSFLWKFDFGVKRLMRAVMLMSHISLITLAIFAIYSRGHHTISPASPYVITFIVGLFSFTPPERLTDCFKTRMISIQKTQEGSSATTRVDSEVVLQDNSWCCKALFFTLTTLLQVFALVICACFTWGAQNSRVSFRLEREDGRVVVIVWFCTLIWGFIILQEIKVLFVTCISLWQVTQMLKTGEAWKENKSFFWTFVKILTPATSINLCLDALHVIRYKNEDLNQVKQQVFYEGKLSKSGAEKTKTAVGDSQAEQEPNYPELTTDRKQIVYPQRNESSFVEDQDQEDNYFDELPLKSDQEDDYSEEDKVMNLPNSARGNLSSSKPPVLNPVPRIQVVHESGSRKYQQSTFNEPTNIELSAKANQRELDNKYLQQRDDSSDRHEGNVMGQDAQMEDTEREIKSKKDKKEKKSKKEKKHKKSKKSKREPGSDEEISHNF